MVGYLAFDQVKFPYRSAASLVVGHGTVATRGETSAEFPDSEKQSGRNQLNFPRNPFNSPRRGELIGTLEPELILMMP